MRAHLIRGWIVAILATLAVALVAAPGPRPRRARVLRPGRRGAPSPRRRTSSRSRSARSSSPRGTPSRSRRSRRATSLRGRTGRGGRRHLVGPVAGGRALPGSSRADYRVVSTDGHPVEGVDHLHRRGGSRGRRRVARGAGKPGRRSCQSDGGPPASRPSRPVTRRRPHPARRRRRPTTAGGVLIWVLGLGLAILVGARRRDVGHAHGRR